MDDACPTRATTSSDSSRPGTGAGEAFERERERVAAALGSNGFDAAVRRVEHVGSTAVPGLAAKDVVDLDVVVADDAVESVSRTLVSELGGTRFENSRR